MKKNGLINILSEILIPSGFKKKGNYWVINGDEITKMVNLQKSNHGNFFYVNYGFILNNIPLDNTMMHIYNRVTSLDVEEKNKITFLLDLENNISDEERTKALKEILQSKLVAKVQTVNTEEDLLAELERRPHLNDISLAVKKHFNLPI